jgi:hypothetical protein
MVDSLFGTLGGIRTPDPLFRRQMLYPAELPVRKFVTAVIITDVTFMSYT